MSPDFSNTSRSDWQRVPGPSQRYFLKSDPSITISRRQFDKNVGVLKEQGFTSYEQRQKQNPPKRVKKNPPIGGVINIPTKDVGNWKEVTFSTIADAQAYITYGIPKRAAVWVIVYGDFRFYKDEDGSVWRTVISRTLQPWVAARLIGETNTVCSKVEKVAVRWQVM